MSKVTFDYSKAAQFISEHEVEYMKKLTLDAKEVLVNKTGAGNDFLGWTTLPSEITKEFIQDIKEQAEMLRKKSEIFVVVGIGGSYLGARAVIEALSHQFSALINKVGNTQVVYAGHNMSEEYMVELLELLDNKEYSMAVISKSGTTTEPAVAFRILKNHIEKKYGKGAVMKLGSEGAALSIEAISTGSLAGHNAARWLAGMEPLTLPKETAIGDLISYANETLAKEDGVYHRYTFAGSEFFARMKERGLYSADPDKIKHRIQALDLAGVYKHRLLPINVNH